MIVSRAQHSESLKQQRNQHRVINKLSVDYLTFLPSSPPKKKNNNKTQKTKKLPKTEVKKNKINHKDI